MTLFFTSDQHYGHGKVTPEGERTGALRFGLRTGFSSTEEMDETMIAMHNSVVRPHDTVYYLGDLSKHNVVNTALILSRLNGKKHWVPGNHDANLLKKPAICCFFESIERIMDLNANGQRIMMCHYPMLTWDRSHYGSWMLHGHSHGNCVYPWDNRIMDVGVDTNNFKPYSFEDIKEYMSKRTFTAVDHHTEKPIKPDEGYLTLI